MRTPTTATEWASRASVLRLWPVSKQTDSSGELGRDVEDVLARFEEPLRERPCPLRWLPPLPKPDRPRGRVRAHGLVAGVVGGESSTAELRLVLVENLDGGRQLVRIDADDDAIDRVAHVLLPPVLFRMDGEVGIANTSWAVPS